MTENTESGTTSGPTLEEIKAEADATRDELARHEAADLGEAGSALFAPIMGSTVIVKHSGKKAPAIVVDVREDGTLDVQIFRGDHMPHSAHAVAKAADDGDGWSWT